MLHGEAGQTYNAVDDEPVLQGAFLEFLAHQTGLPLPPMAESADPTGTIRVRKRGTTHKRVSNRRLREDLGWKPEFSTFREGYAGPIADLISSPGSSVQRPALV